MKRHIVSPDGICQIVAHVQRYSRHAPTTAEGWRATVTMYINVIEGGQGTFTPPALMMVPACWSVTGKDECAVVEMVAVDE